MKIYVAGHSGMVGSAILRALRRALPQAQLVVRTHFELDLVNQAEVHNFLKFERPDYVFIAAGKVGGIEANNTYRAEFIYENLMIESNLIHGAYKAGVRSLMFLGSSCIYPRDCSQPIREDHLLTGPLEQTNEPYALAKIAGIKLCENYNRQYGTNYISLMPTNLYGPGDNYDLGKCHVLPALIRKAHEAKLRAARELEVWGTGSARREFLYVDDLARACIYFMQMSLIKYNLAEAGDAREPLPLLNVGTGHDLTISELATLVMKIVGFEGSLVFDTSKPDGTPQKLLDVSRVHSLGWRASVPLAQGIRLAYWDFLAREVPA